MHTENVVYIAAPIERIFALASDIADWPRILPHYREVVVFEQTPDTRRKVVEMAAVRDGFPLAGLAFPVRWRSVQLCDPERRRIYFKHTAGIAKGMWVVWELTPDPWGRGIRVSIGHDLRYPIGVLNGWFAQTLVGQGFVQSIAGRTLATMKAIAEGEQHGG